ncbi:MAG: cation diffusion facilitator family transporter [Candidatus Gastranaerophilales bacterium]|nr:cation diffusion facilitator family transporter [Candidatus Gastranaerophilales bacterium]
MQQTEVKNRTLIVVVFTLITMVAEIAFGLMTHSMALTADGIHMGTHAFALFVTFFICLIAVNNADKEEKLNALGGYTNSILLGLTAFGILFESLRRIFHPEQIAFSEAILVAVIGLAVNVLCIMVMGPEHHHHQAHDGIEDDEHHHEHENLNFKSAYLHILADAFTSLLAISALLLGKYLGWTVLDPLIGVLGAVVILKWTVELITASYKVLIR